MAKSVNSYEIIIKNETSNDDSSPIASGNKTHSAVSKTANGNASAKNIIKGLVAYNTYAKPFVSQVIGYQINTVSLRTGADEVQQRLQFAYEIAGSAFNIGASILTGAAIGNLPGAIVGAVIGVSTTVMNYANKARTIQINKDMESITLRGLNMRAGGVVVTINGSRGNDK